MDVLIAFLIALLLVFVFTVGWIGKVAALGGVAFFIYALIIIVRYLIGRPWTQPKP